jgi:hypothetical protein
MEEQVQKMARSPETFPPALERALEARAPFTRHAVGSDAVAMRVGRAILPTLAIQRIVSKALKIPRFGALRTDPIRLRSPRISEESDRLG